MADERIRRTPAVLFLASALSRSVSPSRGRRRPWALRAPDFPELVNGKRGISPDMASGFRRSSAAALKAGSRSQPFS